MKNYLYLFLVITSCTSLQNIDHEKTKIAVTLDNWHIAASNTAYSNYFDAMVENSIFIGTDATENWNKEAFQKFAKPFFDKGKAWSFIPLQRNIYLSKDGSTAWFDELLNTQMKICRGSGVLIKENNSWKISHYVLSMTIPNDITNDVIKIKSPIEEVIIAKLKK